jgi:hypothetical protein
MIQITVEKPKKGTSEPGKRTEDVPYDNSAFKLYEPYKGLYEV